MITSDPALTSPQQKKAQILFSAIPAAHLTKYAITAIPTTVQGLYALAEVAHCYLHDLDPAAVSTIVARLEEQEGE